MSLKRSADNITRSYFRHYHLHRIFVELLFSKPSKNSVSLTVKLLSCNFKELVFDFCLNQERNKCWLAAYSSGLSIGFEVDGDILKVDGYTQGRGLGATDAPSGVHGQSPVGDPGGEPPGSKMNLMFDIAKN